MASIFKRDGGWLVKWKDGTGIWRVKRTSCENVVGGETCGMKLWPRAVPRPLRFHDLRATATLLLRAGVDPYRVQRILRHSSVNVTTGTYGHLVVEDLRAAINTLPAGPVAPKFEPLSATGTAPHGVPVVRNFESARTSIGRGLNSPDSTNGYTVDPGGFEPPTPTVSR